MDFIVYKPTKFTSIYIYIITPIIWKTMVIIFNYNAYIIQIRRVWMTQSNHPFFSLGVRIAYSSDKGFTPYYITGEEQPCIKSGESAGKLIKNIS